MTNAGPLMLQWLPGRYAVCRLPAAVALPHWATEPVRDGPADRSALHSITRTDRELSIVIDESRVPIDVQAERGFAALRIVGTLDFALVGILARLTGALANVGVQALAISTFDTDILLVREADRQHAQSALAGVAAWEA